LQPISWSLRTRKYCTASGSVSPAQRVNREPTPPDMAEAPEIGGNFAAHYAKGVDRLAEMQKKCIDVVTQHEIEGVEMWKKTAQKFPGAPRLPLLDLIGNTLERIAETQKYVIDLVVEQNKMFADLVKEGVAAVDIGKGNATNLMQQAVEHSVATHKKFLDHSATQTKAAFETTRQQFGFTGGRADAVADSFQRGVDTIIEAQKELLDVVTH